MPTPVFQWQPATFGIESAHLNNWHCALKDIQMQVRYMKGTDHNTRAEQNNIPVRQYEAHLTFPNSRPDLVPTENHSISITLYRTSYQECQAYLEAMLTDLLSAAAKAT